jgi:hypothetical protein
MVKKQTVKAGKKRSGLGTNPVMDMIIPKTEVAPPEAEQANSRKERYTLNLPTDLIEAAKNAAWFHRMPLTTIAEHGIRAELARLEKENGKPFPIRTGNLSPGRPLS